MSGSLCDHQFLNTVSRGPSSITFRVSRSCQQGVREKHAVEAICNIGLSVGRGTGKKTWYPSPSLAHLSKELLYFWMFGEFPCGVKHGVARLIFCSRHCCLSKLETTTLIQERQQLDHSVLKCMLLSPPCPTIPLHTAQPTAGDFVLQKGLSNWATEICSKLWLCPGHRVHWQFALCAFAKEPRHVTCPERQKKPPRVIIAPCSHRLQ